ncbi:AraC family transcriptional regulator [Rhodothalassium salexigens DSM 2132]|uniref:AraC family transcriptional regulator n=1 Tax=Rhodothalassium salexigens DSM 2132 TaxID=1188247 RepID=A0A4R2PFA7_RHOSA|nr:AraC family transcriptional regulator [Rhodothalassium salexigens]MBB4212214.1 AraC family transcriptional regulator [Rhodothalassium salexigens DSM 2132]MBK1639529.1 hypothetical protein [Rhodothalassium salexigens DSM 2132]TCP32635.1 AraC family transcriptional regulator [Rhodothalassium salexigens DSM 2132]
MNDERGAGAKAAAGGDAGGGGRCEGAAGSGDGAALARALGRYGAGTRLVAAPDGAVLMVESRFGAFDGFVDASGLTKLALNVGRPARYAHCDGDTRLCLPWAVGALAVNPAGQSGWATTSPVTMIGLAVDLARFRWPDDRPALGPDDLAAAAARLTQDPAVASVITAMMRTADDHGASGAFFDHGLALVLGRLAALDPPSGGCACGRVGRLRGQRLARVLDLIEARLGDGVAVAEMAAMARMDASAFTKAFAQATGRTPFAYLTDRRMARAQDLLLAGEPVTATAAAVGYANPAKFAAAFRRRYGCPPSHWRHARRG